MRMRASERENHSRSDSGITSAHFRTTSNQPLVPEDEEVTEESQASGGWFSFWGSNEDHRTGEVVRQLKVSRTECAELASKLVRLESSIVDWEREVEKARRELREGERLREEAVGRAVALQEAADRGWREVEDWRERFTESEKLKDQAQTVANEEARAHRSAEDQRDKLRLELERAQRDRQTLADLNAKLADRVRELEAVSSSPNITSPSTPVTSVLSILSNVASIVPEPMPSAPPPTPINATSKPEAETAILKATIATLRSELDTHKRRAAVDSGARTSVFERDEWRAKEHALKEEIRLAIERAAEWERRWRETGGLGAEVALERLRDALAEHFPQDGEHALPATVISVEPLISHIRRAGARMAKTYADLTESARVNDAQHAKIEDLMVNSPKVVPPRVPAFRSTLSLPPSLEASQNSIGGKSSYSAPGRRESVGSLAAGGSTSNRPQDFGPTAFHELPPPIATRREGTYVLPRVGSSSSAISISTPSLAPSPYPPSPSLSATPFPYPPSSYSPTPTDLDDPPRLVTAMRDLANRYALLQQHSRATDQKLQGQIRANRELKRLIVDGAVGRRKEEGEAILKLADVMSELERTKVDLDQARVRVRELEFVVGEIADARSDIDPDDGGDGEGDGEGGGEDTPTEVGRDMAYEYKSTRGSISGSIVGGNHASELAQMLLRRQENL
ncbi:hypothetical protein M427DRAFT_50400 [Gonapodya prolifera JEL478]|uniref:Uncharacterized protein n=1 Tax=Gonapodya prolifera (strain JEL478) TaxID=1344416 RepID=A0A139AZY8_GONPJ|nr:hypothetical protein M427DRAFT_50400 [Gonapodya prolifera JEL478]|eukprot:KXS22035.1 hypothetical protein M427DRAFT_50400 [Gonapodya prolifera JEL478]